MPEGHDCLLRSPALPPALLRTDLGADAGREAGSSALAPWNPSVAFPREPTPSPPVSAGRPETPRNSRAPRAALHLFKFVITSLSLGAASVAPVRARCGVLLSALRAFLGSVPASWLCCLLRGWPRWSPFRSLSEFDLLVRDSPIYSVLASPSMCTAPLFETDSPMALKSLS